MGALTDWIDGGRLDLIIDAINEDTGTTLIAAISALPSATDAATAVLAGIIEGSVTMQAALRLTLAALVGKVSGAPDGPIVFRDTGDTTDRITAVVDENGNRTDVDLDAS